MKKLRIVLACFVTTMLLGGCTALGVPAGVVKDVLIGNWACGSAELNFYDDGTGYELNVFPSRSGDFSWKIKGDSIIITHADPRKGKEMCELPQLGEWSNGATRYVMTCGERPMFIKY